MSSSAHKYSWSPWKPRKEYTNTDQCLWWTRSDTSFSVAWIAHIHACTGTMLRCVPVCTGTGIPDAAWCSFHSNEFMDSENMKEASVHMCYNALNFAIVISGSPGRIVDDCQYVDVIRYLWFVRIMLKIPKMEKDPTMKFCDEQCEKELNILWFPQRKLSDFDYLMCFDGLKTCSNLCVCVHTSSCMCTCEGEGGGWIMQRFLEPD